MKLDKDSEEYKEFRRKANLRSKKYYLKHRERLILKHREYRKNNKKKISEYGKELRARPKTKERLKKWKENNKEHLKEENKKRYQEQKKNGIKAKIDKEYRENNKEKLKQYRARPETIQRIKKWYDENREHLKEVRRKYYKSNKGQLSVQTCNHRRLALKKQRPTDLTAKKIREIFKRDKICVYCGSDIKLELDHIVPLVNQGTCMSNNFVIACEVCNRSKNGRDVFYWCNLQGIDVPKIVLEQLEKQNQGIENKGIGLN